MSVSNLLNKVIYSGDNTSTDFPFTFNIYEETDLIVSTVLLSTGVETALTLNFDYTVTITSTSPSSGKITLSSPLLSGTSLIILRKLPLTQEINIANYSEMPAKTWNEGFDRPCMIEQQLQEQLNRSIVQNPLSSTPLTLPAAVDGKVLGWSGQELVNLDNNGGGGGGGGGTGSTFNPPLDDSNLKPITSANKVNGSALYALASIVAGAGIIPIANLPVGTTASKLVQLTAAAKYPAVDGSLITKLDGSNFLNLANIPSGAGIIPAANVPTSVEGFYTASDTILLAANASVAIPQADTVLHTFTVKRRGTVRMKCTITATGGGGGATVSCDFILKDNLGSAISSQNCTVSGGAGTTNFSKDFTDVVPGSTIEAHGQSNGGSSTGNLTNCQLCTTVITYTTESVTTP